MNAPRKAEFEDRDADTCVVCGTLTGFICSCGEPVCAVCECPRGDDSRE